MSLMVSVTSSKCSPMTIAQTIMQGLPEGMATSEWQVIPQCVPCPQSDPISSLPNFAISSKHGHFGLQKKTRLGWLWRHTWRLQNCGPQTNGCLRSCRRQSQVKVLESSLDNQGDVANLLSKKLICSQNRPDLPGNTHTHRSEEVNIGFLGVLSLTKKQDDLIAQTAETASVCPRLPTCVCTCVVSFAMTPCKVFSYCQPIG